jgi:L-ascorbate metabolism protein UlaG (beta-lactamase superfamily)
VEITFIGHSCFQLKNKDITLVIDPYNPKKVGYKLPKLSADVVLVTHDHEDHNFVEGVSDYKLLINSPGEYEIQEAFVWGISTCHDSTQGKARGKNNIYLIEAAGIDVLHLGDLGHELSKETLSRIPNVDVLLIPVGGKYTIDAEEATKVISSLEPGIVVPMHFATPDLSFAKDLDDVSKFLNEMGIEDAVQRTTSLKLKCKSSIPQETEVVVLKPQH